MSNGMETAGSKTLVSRQPLSGRTIVLTRTLEQAAELTALLQSLGANVIHCPTIEIVEPGTWAPADAAIAKIDSYDWILFTSANSVEFFIGRLLAQCPNGLLPLNQLVKFAIGSATARKLEAYGLKPDLLAAESTGEASVDSIINYVGPVGTDALNGLRMLFPRAKAGRDALPDGLRKAGAIVDVIEIYQTISTRTDSSILQVIRESKIDAITFTSPSTVSSYVQQAGGVQAINTSGEPLVACIGPTTAAAARELGMNNVVYPRIHSVPALVELLAERLGE